MKILSVMLSAGLLVGASLAQADTIVLSGDKVPANPGGHSSCVEVEIGGEKAPDWNCLNQKLEDEVNAASGAPAQAGLAPISANSPTDQVGGFNPTAMSQQYGSNWGKSAVPFRPPAPTFGDPLHVGGRTP